MPDWNHTLRRHMKGERERLIWSSDEPWKTRGKKPNCHGGVRGTLPEIEFALHRISLPRFSGWFSLIPDSATLSLCKIYFRIDSRSVALPPAEYFGGTRQKADSGSSGESSHFHQEKCCVTDSRAVSRWVGDQFQITNDGFGNGGGGWEWTMFTLPTPSHLL